MIDLHTIREKEVGTPMACDVTVRRKTVLRDYVDDGTSKVSRGSKRKVSNTNEVFYYPHEP